LRKLPFCIWGLICRILTFGAKMFILLANQSVAEELLNIKHELHLYDYCGVCEEHIIQKTLSLFKEGDDRYIQQNLKINSFQNHNT
jgi:hypothetical protein